MKRFFEKAYRLSPDADALTGAVRIRDDPERTMEADAGSGRMRRKRIPAVTERTCVGRCIFVRKRTEKVRTALTIC